MLTPCLIESANWANLYPCTDGTGSSAPSYWWCGNDTDVTCSKTSGTVLDITPGLAYKLLTSTAASSSTTSASAISSPTSSTTAANSAQQTTSCASSTESCDKSDGRVAAVGAGVGASLGALSLTMLVMYLNERRRRKKVQRTMAETPMGAGTIDYYVERKSSQLYNHPQELGANEPLRELGPRY